MKLPDQPGTLARLTSIIAARGGNVLGVDIHEMDSVHVVDDFIIEAPEDWDAEALAGEVGVTGAELVSAWPTARWRDPVVLSLEWAAAMASAAPQDSELELSRTVGEVVNASAAWVCTAEEAAAYDAGRSALAKGGPMVRHPTIDDPDGEGEDLPAGMEIEGLDRLCLLAVPDDELTPILVAFAARPMEEPFTTSEIARLSALLKLFRALMPAVAR